MRMTALLLALLVSASACAADEASSITVTRPGGASALPAEDYESTMVVPELRATIEVEGAVRDIDGVGEALIADAQRTVSETLDQARRRRSAAPDIFRQWTLSIDWTATYRGPDVASALGVTTLGEGAAAPVETFETAVVDRITERRLSIGELFGNAGDGGPAMTALAEAAFLAWAEVSPHVGDDLDLVDERVLQDARDGLTPRAASFATFTLAASARDPDRFAGLTFYYPAGVLADRSEGPYRLTVPVEAVAAHL
ncbi:MAG: hypothetical protein PVI23_03785, partial [Maricaulaceae bacterium]